MADQPRALGDGRWRTLLLLVVNGLAQAGAAVVAALATERLFRSLDAVNPMNGRELIAAVGAFTVASIGTAALRGRERVDAERLGQAYTHRLRLHLFEHLTNMSPRTVQQRTQGATSLRFVGDLSMVRRWVSLGLSRLVVAGAMTTGAVIALAAISPPMAAAVTAVAGVGAVALVSQGDAVRSTTRGARRRRARLAGNVNEKIAAVGVVQVHGAVDRERRRIGRQSRRLRDAMVVRAGRLGRLDAIVEATAAAATAAVLVVGVLTEMPAPTVAASMVMVGLLVPQLRGLGRVQEYWQGMRVAREAIDRFLARPTYRTSGRVHGGRLPPGGGQLELDGVDVAGALVGFSATAQPGQTIAIVGPNGAGKSTLLAVIAQMVEPDAGSVRLDGHDLATVPLEEVRRALGLVAADLPLLRGTLRANLSYRCPEADDADIADIVASCELDDFVASLPAGLDTRLNEGGRDLSSGQRQRILLARALVGHPSLLLLDEADANLDPSTTTVVDRVLQRYAGTAIIVTHRRERLAVADAVWHLRDGRLVEHGPPDELLTAHGPTALLFAADSLQGTAT